MPMCVLRPLRGRPTRAPRPRCTRSATRPISSCESRRQQSMTARHFKEWKSYANLHQFDTANAHIAEETHLGEPVRRGPEALPRPRGPARQSRHRDLDPARRHVRAAHPRRCGHRAPRRGRAAQGAPTGIDLLAGARTARPPPNATAAPAASDRPDPRSACLSDHL